MDSYVFKIAELSQPMDISWDEAQNWCNFVLFKPTWLPHGLTETSSTLRPESPKETSSHRVEFHSSKRSLSIKQFLYDWAPPAYDHPCLWRNAKISNPENTPLPKAYLLGNAYLWIGLDYRRKHAATINTHRTQIEITLLHGTFDDQEIIQVIKGLIPINIKEKESILATSFAKLMFHNRHSTEVSDVPTSYFSHIRTKNLRCYPYPAQTTDLDFDSLPGSQLMNILIKDYRLDSLFLFGQDQQNIKEVEYYFESFTETGSYIRFLVTQKDEVHSIQYPPKLGDQECHYTVQKLESGKDLHHAWSKTNDRGSHSLIFAAHDSVINCIIKPTPWTTMKWARELCSHIPSKLMRKK